MSNSVVSVKPTESAEGVECFGAEVLAAGLGLDEERCRRTLENGLVPEGLVRESAVEVETTA